MACGLGAVVCPASGCSSSRPTITIAWAVHFLTMHPSHLGRVRREVDALLGPGEPRTGAQAPVPRRVLQRGHEALVRGAGVCGRAGVRCRTPWLSGPEGDANHDAGAPDGDPGGELRRRIALRPGLLARRAGRKTPSEQSARLRTVRSGPRICPGRSLALVQIQTVLAMLCRNVELAPVRGGGEVGEHLAFTMMPTHSAVRLNRRTGYCLVGDPSSSGPDTVFNDEGLSQRGWGDPCRYTIHRTRPIEGADHRANSARKHQKKVGRKSSIRTGQMD